MTVQSIHTDHTRALSSRSRIVWLILVQVSVLGLTGLAFKWSPVPGVMHQALLLMLAIVLLVMAFVPAWRRGTVTGMLAGLAVALACWCSRESTWQISEPLELALIALYIPRISLVVVGAAVVLAVWGGLLRLPLLDQSRLGTAAVIGGALLGLFGAGFYLVLNHPHLFTGSDGKQLYGIDAYQLAALLAAALTYPSALWLGSVSIRPGRHAIILPAGLAVMIGAYLAYWHFGVQGGQG